MVSPPNLLAAITRTSSSNSGNQRAGAGNANGKGGKASGSKPKTPAYVENLTPEGHIKEAERERRRRNNLCMYCGGSGHKAEDCKKRANAPSGRGACAESSSAPQESPEQSKN